MLAFKAQKDFLEFKKDCIYTGYSFIDEEKCFYMIYNNDNMEYMFHDDTILDYFEIGRCCNE